MPKELASLSMEEQQDLMNAIPLITILVAGADGNIDTNELSWAKKVTEIRSYEYAEELLPFYKKVGETYSDKLDSYMANLPEDKEERQAAIAEQLSKLNDILPKLDNFYSKLYYDSLLSFAKHVAKASGGFLGFGSIGPEEHKVISLDMITPIEE